MDAGDAEPTCVRLEEIGKQREHTLRLRFANEVHATAADVAPSGELAPTDDRDSLFLDEAAFHRLDVAEQDRQLRLREHPSSVDEYPRVVREPISRHADLRPSSKPFRKALRFSSSPIPVRHKARTSV